jgi:regulator of RNase E activity RraA
MAYSRGPPSYFTDAATGWDVDADRRLIKQCAWKQFHPLIANTPMSKTLDLLTCLACFDTPTICNTIELFDVRPDTEGYMDGRIRAAFPELAPMVGFATTATFRSAWPAQGGSAYTSLERQLREIESLPGPAIVVFQDLDDPPVGATFGEVMCSVYQAFHAVGLITSGGGRDLAQVRALRFPVFTGTTICSHGYSQTVDVGLPVRVGGLQVRPGDLLHGDANGVTNIPVEIAAEVADAAREFVEAEKLIIDYAQAEGAKTMAEMMDRRRAMGEAIAALRQRVSRQASARKDS